MKRFAFRLESVLRVRAFELDRARVTLALLEGEVARRAAVVREAAERLASARAVVEAEMSQGTDAQHLVMRADGLAVGRLRLQAAERARDELIQPLAEARRLVQHHLTRVRSLERLRDRSAEEHRREGLAAEQAELEELALSRIALARIEARRIAEERFE